MSDTEINARLELARKIAVSAGKLTLKYFQTDQFEVQKKGDGSPLTIADQESESHLREQISAHFPDDAIVGEEFGNKEGTSGFGWILDPIDGTKSFISGVPLYGTMVAVEQFGDTEEKRQSIIGSIYFPGLDVGMFAARGQGTWSFKADEEPVRASVSKKDSLSDSVMVTSSSDAFGKRDGKSTWEALADKVYFTRTWGDVYGYYLVAIGRVEVMIDPMLNVWDAAAVQPIIEEAGGTFTDWTGESRIDGGDAIGSNGLLHEKVVAITKAAPKLS